MFQIKLLTLLLSSIHKKTLVLFFVLLTSGCANYSFVYDTKTNKNILDNLVSVEISGDDSSTIKQNLTKKININNDSNTHILLISSKRKNQNLVVKENQTASKIEITYEIEYSLKSQSSQCLVLNKKIITSSSYNSRSAGLSFGSDLSKQKILEDTIKQNLKVFLEYVQVEHPEIECKNED